ncbi:butyrophilin subfamily 2 member A2-like [Nothoprocta perdicaria]|uniref:butyrophilin subfamily 2 member A2-like n=1 Tax=Nothoprocta perdicaria TaxID=30464 RepID=UPI000E1BC9E8|nr:butyrophilin subfamily 2 member A2-like [Nothoprocta perdicaria]
MSEDSRKVRVLQLPCSKSLDRRVLFFGIPICFLIIKWLTGEAPITIITVNAPAVLVGGQATLQCWLDDSVHSNTSVLWYKKEEGKNITLCSSSSLGGVVEQHHNDEWNRTEGHWEGRTLVLIIRQVQVADEGTYVCVVRGDNGSQEAAAHLDITQVGNKPFFQKKELEENMCRYTCKSKGWYPRPKVLWRNYGGKTLDVEANTNITWNEEDLFAIQSNITVPCNDVDVMCVVILPKTKINQTGEDLSSLAKTYILQEENNIFAIESSIQKPCEQMPAALMSTDTKFGLHLLAQKSELSEWFWFVYIFCHLILIVAEKQQENVELQKENEYRDHVIEELRARGEARKDVEKEKLREEIEQLQADKALLEREMEFRKARGYADDIKLDVDTAHPNLSFSEDRKSFKHDPHSQKVPHTERRFDSAVCVLGSEGFSSGNHYWEVEVEKSNDWDLGVARRSVQKKGVIYLSVKEGFWVMGSSLRDYWARTDPWTRVTVQRKPRKIGVYLSCEEKLLTFFNVTDMSVMFTFKDCAFSEEVYPFFKNSQKESTMRICSVEEK